MPRPVDGFRRLTQVTDTPRRPRDPSEVQTTMVRNGVDGERGLMASFHGRTWLPEPALAG